MPNKIKIIADNIHHALLNSNYSVVKNEYTDQETGFTIKFNRKSITFKSKSGTQVIYQNPSQLSIGMLHELIQKSMI